MNWNTDFAFWFLFFITNLVTLGVAVLFKNRGVEKQANEIKAKLELSANADVISAIADPKTGSFVKTLLDELSVRGNTSLSIVSEFTQYHYIAILAAILSGAFGGVATFLVTSFGWDGSNQSLKGFFMACAAALPFWLAMIQVFKYPDTIAKHEAIYASCSNMVSDIQRVAYCPPLLGANGQAFDLKDYIASIAAKCESVRAIGVSFDGSKISMGRIELPK